MDILQIVEENIKLLIKILKEIESFEFKKNKNNKEIIDSRKYATQMFRSLLKRRDELKAELNSTYPITVTICD
jgi:hypothetical protein